MINFVNARLSWDPLLENETNGEVVEYKITGIPKESFTSTVVMSVKATILTAEFDCLEARFTVVARTQMGYGPDSPEILVRTSQTGINLK